MTMKPRVRDHWCRAKWAFSGVYVLIKFRLRTAIVAGHNARFFNLGLKHVACDGGAQVKFVQRAALPWATRNIIRVAAVVANQPILSWIKPEIRPAVVAGKAVFVCGLWFIAKVSL